MATKQTFDSGFKGLGILDSIQDYRMDVDLDARLERARTHFGSPVSTAVGYFCKGEVRAVIFIPKKDVWNFGTQRAHSPYYLTMERHKKWSAYAQWPRDAS